MLGLFLLSVTSLLLGKVGLVSYLLWARTSVKTFLKRTDFRARAVPKVLPALRT